MKTPTTTTGSAPHRPSSSSFLQRNATLSSTLLFILLFLTSTTHVLYQQHVVPILRWITTTTSHQWDDVSYYHRQCDSRDITTDSLDELVLGDSSARDTDLVLQHGAGIIPDLLSQRTAEDLREVIMSINRNQAEEEQFYILNNQHRWATKMGLHDDEGRHDPKGVIPRALHEISQHFTLKRLLEDLLGPEPAIVEMSAITSEYGAESQNWHSDTGPSGSSTLFDQTYLPLYSVFVLLQNTTEEMGATQICPGTHLCPDWDIEDCDEHSMYATLHRGDALIYNSEMGHRGTKHVDPQAEERAMLLLSFVPRPRPGDARLLPAGAVYAQRWDIWGNTLADMEALGDGGGGVASSFDTPAAATGAAVTSPPSDAGEIIEAHAGDGGRSTSKNNDAVAVSPAQDHHRWDGWRALGLSPRNKNASSDAYKNKKRPNPIPTKKGDGGNENMSSTITDSRRPSQDDVTSASSSPSAPAPHDDEAVVGRRQHDTRPLPWGWRSTVVDVLFCYRMDFSKAASMCELVDYADTTLMFRTFLSLEVILAFLYLMSLAALVRRASSSRRGGAAAVVLQHDDQEGESQHELTEDKDEPVGNRCTGSPPEKTRPAGGEEGPGGKSCKPSKQPPAKEIVLPRSVVVIWDMIGRNRSTPLKANAVVDGEPAKEEGPKVNDDVGQPLAPTSPVRRLRQLLACHVGMTLVSGFGLWSVIQRSDVVRDLYPTEIVHPPAISTAAEEGGTNSSSPTEKWTRLDALDEEYTDYLMDELFDRAREWEVQPMDVILRGSDTGAADGAKHGSHYLYAHYYNNYGGHPGNAWFTYMLDEHYWDVLIDESSPSSASSPTPGIDEGGNTTRSVEGKRKTFEFLLESSGRRFFELQPGGGGKLKLLTVQEVMEERRLEDALYFLRSLRDRATYLSKQLGPGGEEEGREGGNLLGEVKGMAEAGSQHEAEL